MNEPIGTYEGGWPATTMRTYLNSTILNAIPEDLRNGIIDTYVVSGHGLNDESGTLQNHNFESIDKLYLLSPQEIYGDSFTSSEDTSNGTSRQLDYYEYNKVNITNKSETIKKKGEYATYWSFRSPRCASGMDTFYLMWNTGELGTGAPNQSYGVSPIFRIG